MEGKPLVKRSRKERIYLGTLICKKYAEGLWTIESVCKEYGVSIRAFTNWAYPDEEEFELLSENIKKLKLRGGYVTEVARAYKKSKEDFKTNNENLLRERAVIGLSKLVQDQDIEEVITEFVPNSDGNPIQKYMRRIKKTRSANPTAIIFALKNLRSDTFSDTLVQRHEGSLHTHLSKLSDKDLLDIINGKVKKDDIK